MGHLVPIRDRERSVMSALITITHDGSSIMFDVLEDDAPKIIAKIERMMSGYIVARTVVA
jgi:hypothetical protein